MVFIYTKSPKPVRISARKWSNTAFSQPSSYFERVSRKKQEGEDSHISDSRLPYCKDEIAFLNLFLGKKKKKKHKIIHFLSVTTNNGIGSHSTMFN